MGRWASLLHVGLAALVWATVSPGWSGPAEAKGARTAAPHPAIPFEADRAAARGERAVLRLNDESSAIPAHRIRDLPVINGRLGDHARLDGGLLLYFPNGRIVSSEIDIHKYREDPASPGQWVPDSRYRHVARFDHVLGAVCASEGNPASAAGRVEMRLRKGQMISLVTVKEESVAPGVHDVAYRVVSATSLHDLKEQPMAQSLYRHCTTRNPKIANR